MEQPKPIQYVYHPGQNGGLLSGRRGALYFVAVGVGGLVLFHFIQKWQDDRRRRRAELRAASDINVGHALGLRSAMNPSGNRWMFYFDGTDENAIYRIAEEIKDLQKVQEEYSNLYSKDSLLDDLKSEIDTTGTQKFLALASKGKVGSKYYSPEKLKQPVAYYALTTARVNIRNTPEKTSNVTTLPGSIIPVPSFKSNVLKVAEKGKLLGLTTGKSVYDEKNDVLFVEVIMQTEKQEKKYVWVAKSQVELLSQTEKDKRDKIVPFKYETLKGIELSGLTDSQYNVVVKRPANVYNENMKIVATVFPGVILGFYEGKFNTAQGNFVRLTTVQGHTRYVRESDIKLVRRDK